MSSDAPQTTTKHTPGPWRAFDASDMHEPHLGPVFVVGPERFHTVAEVRPGETDDDLPAQTPANARLIAAAPDLLAALEGVLRVADRATVEFDAARAAIAKAKLGDRA